MSAGIVVGNNTDSSAFSKTHNDSFHEAADAFFLDAKTGGIGIERSPGDSRVVSEKKQAACSKREQAFGIRPDRRIA